MVGAHSISDIATSHARCVMGYHRAGSLERGMDLEGGSVSIWHVPIVDESV